MIGIYLGLKLGVPLRGGIIEILYLLLESEEPILLEDGSLIKMESQNK